MSVILRTGGKDHGGWKSIHVTRSLETISGAFSLGLTERWADGQTPRTIKNGERCTVLLDGETVITGYVDAVKPSYDSTSHTLDVEGRDATGDLVDCSAIHASGQWSGLTLDAIATILCKSFGITVKTQVSVGEAFKKFNLQQGETVHEAIERMCRLRAVLAIADRKGNLILTRAGTARAGTALVEGRNILSASGEFDYKERFSTVYVKGQTQGDDNTPGAVSTRGAGHASDKEITRYRPLLVMAEGQANAAQCQQRAQWEVAVRSGRSRRCTITVQGWRQDNGALWDINTLVPVNSPMLGVNTDMLISEVSYVLDESGQKTELTVVRKEAFELIRELEKPKGKRGRKKKDEEAFAL